MVTNDKGFIPLKHRVIEGLARIAWNGEVTEEAKEGLIRELSPGPKAAFRCCVYKEREILQRPPSVAAYIRKGKFFVGVFVWLVMRMPARRERAAMSFRLSTLPVRSALFLPIPLRITAVFV